MKNLLKSGIILLMLIAATPFQMNAKDVKKTETKIESVEAKVLTDRLLVIEKMDKSTLTRVERKALRKEVKSINTNLADLNGGVYLTTGAIIIIILLLILIL